MVASKSQKKLKILISGAGIAGPTLAYWLVRMGHDVTVIEISPAPRTSGQNIDISDSAIDVVKMMGIEDEILRHNTTELGLKIVDAENKVKAIFPKDQPLAFTSKYEILRGDLAGILISLTRSSATYRYDEEIKSLDENNDSVRVTFKSGTKADFDIVVGADGVSSATRKKISHAIDPYKFLGVYTSYATIPKRESDDRWARWYNAPKGKVLLLRPDNKGTTRASVNVWIDGPPEAHFSNEEAVAFIQKNLADAGWEADRISADIEKDPDIYLGPVSQVRLPRWSQGRCVLIGDAAYCPTPFTGMGTTLAILGAYVLAGELSENTDYEVAFKKYEERLRPFVEDVQRVFPLQFRMVYPQSKWGVRVFNSVLSFFSKQIVQFILRKLSKKPKEDVRKFELPRYSKLRV